MEDKQLLLPVAMDQLAGVIRTMPQIEVPLKHRFTPGLYSREIQLPAGSINISKIHKSEHQFIISKGHVEVYDPRAGKSVHYVAPYHGITKPGTQRAVYAHEDSVWTTFHATDETDTDKIEQAIIQEPEPGSITISDEAMIKLRQGKLE